MNKKIINIIIVIVLILLIVKAFFSFKIIQMSIIESMHIFIYNVFPFLFTMMIINNLLVNINFPYFINKIFKNNIIYIFIMSALSGAPTNAIIINEFLEKKVISEEDAGKILSFTSLNNPLFLYSYFNLIFHNNLIILKLFFIIYIENIIIMSLFIKKNQTFIIKYRKYNIKSELIKSINKTILTLINIFAIISFFKLISDLLLINNNILTALLKGLLEITQGLNILSKIKTSILVKEILVMIILSFGGLSIHIQISNILNNYNINYKYFYLSRIFLIIITIILIYMDYLMSHYHLIF